MFWEKNAARIICMPPRHIATVLFRIASWKCRAQENLAQAFSSLMR